MSCLNKCQQWPTASHIGSARDWAISMDHDWVLFLVSATRSPVPHCDVERAGWEHSPSLGWGALREVAWNPETIKADLCPSYQVQVNEQMLLTREMYASHNPPGPLIQPGGSSLPPRTREVGNSICGSQHSPPQGWVSSWVFALFLWVSSQGHRSLSTIFLPTVNYMCIFLIALVVRPRLFLTLFLPVSS